MTIPNLKGKGHVSSVLGSYVFSNVNFLHFGELKMRFLDIVPFVNRKYIHFYFDCLIVIFSAEV